MLADDRVEILGFPDHHLALDDRLDAVAGGAFARQDALAGEAQGDDLPPARAVGLIFGEDPRAHEHDLVALRPGLAERPPRIDLDQLAGHRRKLLGER